MSDNYEDSVSPLIFMATAEGTAAVPQMPIAENQGQLFQISKVFRFVECAEIPKGYLIAPVEMHSENAHGFAALHLIKEDFAFALACLQRAQAMGRPDSANVDCKAFIWAGIVAYARPFAQGVRGVRLAPEMFAPVWNEDDEKLHQYLYGLRDKHIAHSVNEFERGDPIGIIVLSPEGVRKEDVSGIGVMLLKMVGINAQRLDLALHHVEHCMKFIDKRIEEMRPDVHADLKAQLSEGWKMAPMLRGQETRSDVRKPRTSFGSLRNVLQRLMRP